MLTHTLLMFALMMSPDIDPPPKYKAWIQDHEVWMETSSGDRRITYDALGAEPAAVSPAGDRVVYGVINPNFDAEHCGNTPQKYVALVNTFGNRLWKAALEEACNDFTKFEWIDDHRIGVMLCGRVNCVYWVLAAGSGAVEQKFSGGFDFLWSHNRRWVAHRRLWFNEEDGGVLMFNDNDIVYPPLDPKAHRFPSRDIGELSWSPDDSWVSFYEVEYPSEDHYIVLVSPNGNFLRIRTPIAVDNPGKIDWTDLSHFQIDTFGKGVGHLVRFRFVVENGEIREIVQRVQQ